MSSAFTCKSSPAKGSSCVSSFSAWQISLRIFNWSGGMLFLCCRTTFNSSSISFILICVSLMVLRETYVSSSFSRLSFINPRLARSASFFMRLNDDSSVNSVSFNESVSAHSTNLRRSISAFWASIESFDLSCSNWCKRWPALFCSILFNVCRSSSCPSWIAIFSWSNCCWSVAIERDVSFIASSRKWNCV